MGELAGGGLMTGWLLEAFKGFLARHVATSGSMELFEQSFCQCVKLCFEISGLEKPLS